MKKLFKNYITLFSVLALFSACTEEVEYTPAQPSEVAETEYYFNKTQPISVVLSLTDTEYVVVLERVNSENEVTLDLDVNVDDNVFNVPETVTFEAGKATAEVVISINENMEPFKEYKIEVGLPEKYINPYKEDNYSIFNAKLIKEDYAPYAKGVYAWGFMGMQYYQEVEYSEILGAYRLPSPWSTPASGYVAAGYGAENGGNVVFFLNEETGEITLENNEILSGLIHPTYGSITANYLAGMVDEEGTLLFQYKWTCSAGSFGSAIDKLQIVEIY